MQTLKDILKQASDTIKGIRYPTIPAGSMKPVKSAGSIGKDPGVDYKPKAGDEQEFVAAHSVEKWDHIDGNATDFATKGVKYSLETPQNARMGNIEKQAQAAEFVANREEVEVDGEVVAEAEDHMKRAESYRKSAAAHRAKGGAFHYAQAAQHDTYADEYEQRAKEAARKKKTSEETDREGGVLEEMSNSKFLTQHHEKEAAFHRDEIRKSKRPSFKTSWHADQAAYHEGELKRLQGLTEEQVVEEQEKCNHTRAGIACPVHGKTLCPGTPSEHKKQMGRLKETMTVARRVITEKLTKRNDAGDWIHDFVHSDNPRFDGKSKSKRIDQALAAYYAKQEEAVEVVTEAKMVNMIPKSVNLYGSAKKKSKPGDKESPVLSAVPPNTVPVKTSDVGFGISG
jgi:hypothetical protein